MKITLLTYGSQGDVEPFAALGKGLVQAGHQVILAAPEKYKFLVDQGQIEFIGFPGDPQQLVQDLVDHAGHNWWRMVRSMSSFVLPLGVDVSRIARMACQDADLIVHSFLLTNTGYQVAREKGIPDISAQTFPVFTSTSEFPAPAAPDLPLGNFYRKFTHHFVTQTFWQGSRILYRWIRKGNPELPPLSNWPFDNRNSWQTPILYAFSPQVVPRPADWREDVHITGYWFSDQEIAWKPADRLLEFLKKGPSPIAVVFGSTSTRELAGIYHKVVETLKDTDQKGIIVGQKPAGLNLPNVFWQEGFIPYDWLFKRSAAVIHHGGAGTTGKALKAGLPSIVLPFTSDQPFWGRQVQKLGAGPKPINPRHLNTATLAEAIGRVISDPAMRQRAQALKEGLNSEDGVSTAVQIIESYQGVFHVSSFPGSQ
jgi:UDP:flavonoid glycosyltransferase YjiC (YdhE family)